MSDGTRFQSQAITDNSIIHPLKEEWLKTLTAPQDDMWESFTDAATHWELREKDQSLGYACTNEDNLLLQFYVSPEWMDVGSQVFQTFIHQHKIKKAMVGTNNPVFLSMAMHHQKSVEIDTYLYTDFLKVDTIKKEGFRSAAPDELNRVVDFYHESMGGPKEWLNGYLNNLIDMREVFLLENESEILGTCEVRKSESDPNVAGVGMVVSPAHRRKGLGKHLLGCAKEIAKGWNRQPICSCEKDNIGSVKSIQANGFRSLHQMVSMEF